MQKKLRNLIIKPETSTFIFLMVLFIFMSLKSPAFLTSRNLLTVLRQISTIAICSVGMAFVIISGGIDLSQGRMIGFAAVLGAVLSAEAKMNLPHWVAFVAMLGVPALLGLCNGLMVTRIGLPPFIATLGMQRIVYGLALLIGKATPIKFEASWLTFFGSTTGKFPNAIVVMAIVLVLGFLISKFTVYGRNVYIIGNSEKAALLSGINVKNTKLVPYIFSSLLAGLSGIILLGQMLAGDAAYGDGNELDAIASAVIGGISMAGGEGNILGIIFGAALLGIIKNMFILLMVSPYWQTVVIGLVIIASVTLDCVRKKIIK